MAERQSRKPLVIALILIVLAVVVAAAFVSPQVKSERVEQTLPAENFAK